MERQIYCFWSGPNPLTPARQTNLAQLASVSECEVVLVTQDTLPSYILPEAPLHPAYLYLSYTHRADYLRTYFMHFHGGGYSDIKATTGPWTEAFNLIVSDDDVWIVGYEEIEGGVGYAPYAEHWRHMIGNGAYICKPRTPLTTAWYTSMIQLLDTKLEQLRLHPARHPQDQYGLWGSQYPLEWTEMLGRIFHRVSYDHKEHVRSVLPISIFRDYR